MSKHGKSIWNDWIIWAIVVVVIILVGGIIVLCTRNGENTIATSKQEYNTNNIKEISDNDIIDFAKEEAKKKLRYPETVKFQKEEIIGREKDIYVVSLFSVSDDLNKEEGRLKFVVGMKKNKKQLELVNIATNNDTCNTDVAKEFEELVSQKKYTEIYDNLFATTLKKRLPKSEFANYNLDLSGSKTDAEPTVDSNNYLKYVTASIIDKKGQHWVMIIKNGMIYNFSKILL